MAQHYWLVAAAVWAMFAACAAGGAELRSLRGDDVVFMYAPDVAALKAYGATFVAWGGAHTAQRVREMREIGVHSTGSMWCLTAGAKALHESAELREAVVRDIAGAPIIVPWLFDHTHEGTPSWWGCTNHPVFRQHMRERVRQVMSGGADGLHVDDHLGSAAPTAFAGGCFCDHCMAEFRRWLIANSTPELLAAAGVSSFENFDYRQLVRRHAGTREEYLKAVARIPLHNEFVDCQLALAAENVRSLGQLAAEVAGHPVTLSANTCLPNLNHIVVTKYLTHLVGEVDHGARSGTKNLMNVVRAYRMAEALGRPMAATASGWDWAYVKEHRCENLVRLWIALSYACGQRLMVPHRMWCFTREKGTHWYDGPVEAYAPLYRFVRASGALFRDTRTVGPLAVPDNLPRKLDRLADRRAFAAALDQTRPQPLAAGERVWVMPRQRSDGALVVHVLNLDYDGDGDRIAPARNVCVRLPAGLSTFRTGTAIVHSFDAGPVKVPLTATDAGLELTLPELRLWAIVLIDGQP